MNPKDLNRIKRQDKKEKDKFRMKVNSSALKFAEILANLRKKREKI